MRVTPWKLGGLGAGVAAFLVLTLADTPLKHHPGWGDRPAFAAGVASLMAVWWLTEAIPIYATACVPLVLFPAMGVFGGDLWEGLGETALPYVDPTIFLFMGGMCIAAAMQQWDLHRRIALVIMRAVGTDPGRLLFGFLAATAFVSLWISNTATATMMVPIGMAVVAQFESRSGRRLAGYGAAIMLSIAYAANVGGIGTKIGTAPNAIFAGFMEDRGVEIGFLRFLAAGLPFVVLFLPVIWLALWRVGRRDAPPADSAAEVVEGEIAGLGPPRRAEWVVLAVFAAAASLWMASPLLTSLLKPQVGAFRLRTSHVEGAAAMSAALLLMVWRAGGRAVLEFRSLRKVPWETLLLLGGSFSMAAGVQKSGLSSWMGGQLSGLHGLPFFPQVLAASVATVALSAVASNTATVNVMLSVLHGAVPAHHAPTVLFASTISASCDFALPAGTPPNAIVFGSGYVTVPRMAKTGVLLDLAAAVLAAAWCLLAVPLLVG